MNPRPEPILLNCIRCDTVPEPKRDHIICRICGQKHDSLSDWNLANRFVQIKDLPSRLVHDQYGLQPCAIEALLVMLESSRSTFSIMDSAQMSVLSPGECDLLIAYVIGSLSSRPEPEKILIGESYIMLT